MDNVPDPVKGEDPEITPDWKARIEACEKKRDRLIKETWKTNTNYRKGKPFNREPEEDAVSIPVDWARTKNKAAQLFFQVPNVIMDPQQQGLESAAPVAAAALNDILKREVKAHICMDEVLQDIINAAGFGVILVGIDVVSKTVNVDKYTPDQIQAEQHVGAVPPQIAPEGVAGPSLPDSGPAVPDMMGSGMPVSAPPSDASLGIPPPPGPIAQEIAANGGQMPQIPQSVPIYQCYYGTRISPARFLWPVEFTGSDWQEAPWLGYDEDIPAVVAMRKNWIDKDFLTATIDKLKTTSDATDEDENKPVGKMVTIRHIYYKKYLADLNEVDPRKIGHLVFVKHKDEPVVTEDFKWQKYDEQTRDWIGMTTFPLKVGTVTTLSDEALPPSDSEVGRPQVKELMRSRSQMVKQRDRSMPLRWFDVNQVDDDIAEQMRKGVYQDMIPMNGPGGNAIGEVARANYPRDSWEFQNVIDRDLDEAWSMGRNQQGLDTPGETSATESQIVAQNSNVRIEYERARILRLFLEVAESVFDLMQLFQDDQAWVKIVGPMGVKALQAWDKTTIRGEYAFDAHPDSAVRVDIGQKRTESLNLYKLLRQDPLVNPQAFTQEVIETHGYDPAKVMNPPAPPSPPPAATRFSFVGADLASPMVVAYLQKHAGVLLTPEDLEAAKKLMQDAGVPMMPPTQLPLPVAGKDGQPASSLAPGTLEHPGPAPEVNPLNQRYEQGGNNMIEPQANG